MLGSKVSLRFVLHGDPEHPFSEAVGVVMSVDKENERISLMTKRGHVEVALRDMLAVKVFPSR
ncbi:MAG TPA: hypothetical protein VFK89_12350 [Actinomycetota bacterium]|nr:hypothetical protein [Actinomycetota bacterium]